MARASIKHNVLISLLLTLSLAGQANVQTAWAVVQSERSASQSPSPTRLGRMQLVDSGSSLSRTVTVESPGLFRLVFEAADNWGIAQWYDLVNDPSAKTNLTGPGYGVTRDISTAEPPEPQPRLATDLR